MSTIEQLGIQPQPPSATTIKVNAQHTCANFASCMLQLSNDCDTVVNWYKYQAAKPAAVDLRPHGTNLQTGHESVCMHTMPCIAPHLRQNSCSTTGCTHNDENPTPSQASTTRSGPPSANMPTNITPATVATTITAPLSQHKCRYTGYERSMHLAYALTPAVDCLVVTSSAVTHAQTYNAWHACCVSGM